MRPIPIRPARLIQASGPKIVGLSFPYTGSFSATQDLGICWANSSDHSQTVGAANGFDGSVYFTIDFPGYTVVEDLIEHWQLSLYAVDKTGTDLYQLGATLFEIYQSYQTFGTINMALQSGVPFCGVRGQIDVDNSLGGQVVASIPTTIYFVGH